MNIYILLHLGLMASRMGIAIKSVLSGKYLNLRSLKLEPVDKRRKEDYIFRYDWDRDVPYGFRLYTREGYLTVDKRYRKMVFDKGHGRTRRGSPSRFEFHFVTPTKCKSIIIGHDSGLCMVDAGDEVRFTECMPPGKELPEFRFEIKVFKDRCGYLEKSKKVRAEGEDKSSHPEDDTKGKDEGGGPKMNQDEEKISSETTDYSEPGCHQNVEKEDKKEDEEKEDKEKEDKEKEEKKKKSHAKGNDDESLEDIIEKVRFKRPRIKKKMKRLGSSLKRKLAKAILKVDKKRDSGDSDT
ncbi:hypothetical protein EROM_070990 [Encephalitozoon romaleae SJ-2008]|uniref:Uncharacterized protein n=1 Tax=Encephalitozoon romaleae (strain SJ-2008) TaxID=1178016 RepID=I7AF84_ENCRO|nr:hypothetical protein EROM_070990 [Encephalitozoon romaleae SJ-2008]AFN83350.1 hypothetical protein EROM_070990 [Encephalitozoon romaleae SJ-2008]